MMLRIQIALALFGSAIASSSSEGTTETRIYKIDGGSGSTIPRVTKEKVRDFEYGGDRITYYVVKSAGEGGSGVDGALFEEPNLDIEDIPVEELESGVVVNESPLPSSTTLMRRTSFVKTHDGETATTESVKTSIVTKVAGGEPIKTSIVSNVAGGEPVKTTAFKVVDGFSSVPLIPSQEALLDAGIVSASGKPIRPINSSKTTTRSGRRKHNQHLSSEPISVAHIHNAATFTKPDILGCYRGSLENAKLQFAASIHSPSHMDMIFVGSMLKTSVEDQAKPDLDPFYKKVHLFNIYDMDYAFVSETSFLLAPNGLSDQVEHNGLIDLLRYMRKGLNLVPDFPSQAEYDPANRSISIHFAGAELLMQPYDCKEPAVQMPPIPESIKTIPVEVHSDPLPNNAPPKHAFILTHKLFPPSTQQTPPTPTVGSLTAANKPPAQPVNAQSGSTTTVAPTQAFSSTTTTKKSADLLHSSISQTIVLAVTVLALCF